MEYTSNQLETTMLAPHDLVLSYFLLFQHSTNTRGKEEREQKPKMAKNMKRPRAKDPQVPDALAGVWGGELLASVSSCG